MASISTEETTQHSPQLLLVGEKDSKRLLEVYVKRSLSLNDGPLIKGQKSRKCITIAERNKRGCRYSSDASINLSSQASVTEENVVMYEPFPEPEVDKNVETLSEKKPKKWKIKGSVRRNDGSNASQKSNGKPKKWFQRLDKDKEEGEKTSDVLPPQANTNSVDVQPKMSDKLESSKEEKKDKESKKTKKPTVWKSFLSLFTRGNVEKEQDYPRVKGPHPPLKPSTLEMSCLQIHEALSKDEDGMHRTKSLKKNQSNKRSLKWRRSGDMSTAKSVEMVEPNSSYYEKVSEELEKIVHEVKDSPGDGYTSIQPTVQNGGKISQEAIKRITELIKQEGDLIDDKLKENSSVSSFLESSFSYRSFQQMADQYVQSEVPNKKTHPTVVAPELVKFAFTLDFTARVANLHRQATGHIMGLGNQYLQDRFTHMSESHPHLTDINAEDQKTVNFDQDFLSL
ncbi:uncharacterized protein LOC127646961 [Xyrauchen texanus]|uniref:uncharacterized protein LOC127646961 n=1 Tax=Xyrauchen texanus TaxID=154827 RepID=UPI002241CCCD|nr:uncharacterized protein LOC127646961 [Xyrauchen texanus]XP_051986922.1 uncharacterized protein LOC127646961 [Xyrauchen texanus]